MADAPQKKLRTCIGCAQKRPKAQLVRIQAVPEGGLRWDRSGKAPGRGAYVCDAACLRQAAAKSRLARALKQPVAQEAAIAVADELENAPRCAEAR